jgi:multiple sugar transport system permease protein
MAEIVSPLLDVGRELPLARSGRTIEARAAYALVTPAIVLMSVLLFGPVCAVFIFALTDWQFGASTLQLVGFANFITMATDKVFWIALSNTLAYVAIVVSACVAGGLAVALLIESSPRFRNFYRAAHFLPVMATLVAMAISWEILLHPSIGLVNQALALIGIQGRNWLRDESTALWSLCLIGIWQNLGFAMVLFMAGLKSIPRDLYDAADIDGADHPLDRVRTITLPLLGPVMMFVLVVVSVRALQVFETVKVLTRGGPNKASEVLLHHLYVESFEFLRTGYGAAVTVVYLLIVVGLTLLQARILERRIHYT